MVQHCRPQAASVPGGQFPLQPQSSSEDILITSIYPYYLQLYIMDLFLGRRFFNLGSNIFNYAILRAALNEVDPITLIRRGLLVLSCTFPDSGVPTSRHVFNGRLWLDCLRFQDLRIVHLAGEHCEREDLLDPLVRLPGAHFRRLVAADQVGIFLE